MAASTVDEYIAHAPEERRAALEAVRRLVRRSVASGFEEGILYGMPSWFVPLSRYPDTYNGQPLTIASLASQKGHMALYLMAVYGDPALRESFESAWKKSGKKLDMGKSCLRFRALDDLAIDVLEDTLRSVTVDGFLAAYETARATTESAPKRAGAKKAPAKKAPAKKRA